ncbi:MAG: MotA/TolQ/ExbB proton channel family protein [Gemmataceae bacterium]
MSSPMQPSRRGFGPTLAALLLGLPMAAGALALFRVGPLHHTTVARYVEHPVQWTVVAFFFTGVGALLVKLLQLRRERAACAADILPPWDGKPVPVAKAAELLVSVDRQPGRVQGTYLGRRLRAVLDFLRRRGKAQDLDDQIRALADNDAGTHENSFGLIRFITWAIPILGFLGTVIGITAAIAGVDPETLEESLSMVTGGLAEAFDSTALALGLTMVLMFLTYLVEKQEQAVLGLVDQLVEDQLAHRFQRDALDQAPILAAVRASSEALATSVEGLVKKQADVWAAALGEPERRAAAAYQQAQQTLAAALGKAMDQTVESYAQRLAGLEQQSLQQTTALMQQLAGIAAAIRDTGREQQESLQVVAQGVGQQAATLGRLQEDSANVVHLQAVLHQNLAALANASSFEEAVHSLTAAVHLLTARVGATPGPRLHAQGKAA